jgi:hypothetical protein
METIKRKQAIELGEPFYNTGKPCKHGHLAKRRTKTGRCTECERLMQLTEQSREYHRIKKRTEQYRAKSREYLKSVQTTIKYKQQVRESHLKRTYGITLEQHDRMRDDQANGCAICRKTMDDDCAVDHCHTTGKVRGLLCDWCNKLLGFAKDDVSILQAAIDYLKKAESA